jgi:aspartate kinase
MLGMKFGGTSVGSPERYRHVAQLVGGYQERKPVVVVSAMAGTTDWLLNTARALVERNRADDFTAESAMSEFHGRYMKVIEETVEKPEIRSHLVKEIAHLLHKLVRLYTGIELLGELSPRSLDAVASFGEKISAHLLAGALEDAGFKAQAVNSEELIITNRNYNNARPDMAETEKRCRAKLLPLIEAGIIPVVTGFIGATPEGVTTTLGRSGSDYSVAIVGAALDCQEIWIWKEVDGVMTADPRLVPTARSLRRISYAEAGELSYFGAQVLHPLTVQPAVEKGIPFYIRNTFNPDFPGTLIERPHPGSEGVVKAVTSAKNLALITVSGGGVLTVPGIAARVFTRVSQINANVYMISHASSAHDLCFVVERKLASPVVETLLKEFEQELLHHEIEAITAQDNIIIIAVVGAGMRGTPGVSGRLFSALGKRAINIVAIAQGSSELNISLIVDAKDEKEAVITIHDEFLSMTGLGKSLYHQ